MANFEKPRRAAMTPTEEPAMTAQQLPAEALTVLDERVNISLAVVATNPGRLKAMQDDCRLLIQALSATAPSPLGGLDAIIAEYDGIVNRHLDPRDAEADFVMRGSDWREIRKALADKPSNDARAVAEKCAEIAESVPRDRARCAQLMLCEQAWDEGQEHAAKAIRAYAATRPQSEEKP